MAKEVKVAVGVLTYNRKESSVKCIPQAAYRTGMDCDFYIWDNGSTDGTVDWLINFDYPKISGIYLSEDNVGLEAYNYIFENTDADYFVELDNDIIPPSGYLYRMVQTYAWLETIFKRVGFLGVNFKPWKKGSFSARFQGKPQLVTPLMDVVYVAYFGNSETVPGMCRMSSRETWTELGGQPRELYGTDMIMNAKALSAGMVNGLFEGINGEVLRHMPQGETESYKNWKNNYLKARGRHSSDGLLLERFAEEANLYEGVFKRGKAVYAEFESVTSSRIFEVSYVDREVESNFSRLRRRKKKPLPETKVVSSDNLDSGNFSEDGPNSNKVNSNRVRSSTLHKLGIKNRLK